ncbi:transmembrane protein, putative [Medicago truncatula]|uniref:Transmembrane protein, putative n=1 Tax=Medicago truncatula TaxID=3880 RepID=G7KVZ4_MEDTR|nr:transmembrane protein, putative [Medicago truncatula]
MSQGHCLWSDKWLLDNFIVAPGYRRFKDIMEVTWKAPTAGWVKANIDGSVKAGLASCGGIFRDHRATFLGAFVCNLGDVSVFEAELTGILGIIFGSSVTLLLLFRLLKILQSFLSVSETVGTMFFIGGFKRFALMFIVKVVDDEVTIGCQSNWDVSVSS